MRIRLARIRSSRSMEYGSDDMAEADLRVTSSADPDMLYWPLSMDIIKVLNTALSTL